MLWVARAEAHCLRHQSPRSAISPQRRPLPYAHRSRQSSEPEHLGGALQQRAYPDSENRLCTRVTGATLQTLATPALAQAPLDLRKQWRPRAARPLEGSPQPASRPARPRSEASTNAVTGKTDPALVNPYAGFGSGSGSATTQSADSGGSPSPNSRRVLALLHLHLGRATTFRLAGVGLSAFETCPMWGQKWGYADAEKM